MYVCMEKTNQNKSWLQCERARKERTNGKPTKNIHLKSRSNTRTQTHTDKNRVRIMRWEYGNNRDKKKWESNDVHDLFAMRPKQITFWHFPDPLLYWMRYSTQCSSEWATNSCMEDWLILMNDNWTNMYSKRSRAHAAFSTAAAPTAPLDAIRAEKIHTQTREEEHPHERDDAKQRVQVWIGDYYHSNVVIQQFFETTWSLYDSIAPEWKWIDRFSMRKTTYNAFSSNSFPVVLTSGSNLKTTHLKAVNRKIMIEKAINSVQTHPLLHHPPHKRVMCAQAADELNKKWRTFNAANDKSSKVLHIY